MMDSDWEFSVTSERGQKRMFKEVQQARVKRTGRTMTGTQ